MTSPTPNTKDTSNVTNKSSYVNPKSTDAKTAPPLEEPYDDFYDDISLCQSCRCMTHTVAGECGKCKADKNLGEDAQLIEKLAAIEHERWADWQKWCHKILRENCPSPKLEEVLERWDKQIETSYANLSEKEKQSDRDQVIRYWESLLQWRDQNVQTARIDEINRYMDVFASVLSDAQGTYLAVRYRELHHLKKEDTR